MIIKKAEQRISELKALGIQYTVVSVGKRGNSYFLWRPYIPVDMFLEVAHQDLSEGDKRKLCKLIDFQKLSQEADSHKDSWFLSQSVCEATLSGLLSVICKI